MVSKEQMIMRGGEMIVLFLWSEYLRTELTHLRINSWGIGRFSVLFEGHFSS